jgi:hypothetical protein
MDASASAAERLYLSTSRLPTVPLHVGVVVVEPAPRRPQFVHVPAPVVAALRDKQWLYLVSTETNECVGGLSPETLGERGLATADGGFLKLHRRACDPGEFVDPQVKEKEDRLAPFLPVASTAAAAVSPAQLAAFFDDQHAATDPEALVPGAWSGFVDGKFREVR